MRILLLLAVATLLPAADSFEAFGFKWTVPIGKDWTLEKEADTEVLRMLVPRPQTSPRRPSQFAIADTPKWKKVTLEADVQRLGGSFILVYAYKDAAHFNYAHLSVDDPAKQPVHNGIFHVFGGDRVRISPVRGPGSLPSAEKWYKVRLDYDAHTGEVTVTVDGARFESLHAVDLSLDTGHVGIGSFFETARFRNVRITGTPAP